MFGSEKKKLIVVINDKTAAYGELLSALVTIKDDKCDKNGNLLEDGIIGVKDDSIDVVVWDEKTYLHNKPELNSSNKIIFIGDSKLVKPVMANINMNCELSTYGVHYGILGNKAVICVKSKKITKDRELYNSFIESYTFFISSIGSDYLNTQKVEKTFHIKDYDDERNNNRKKVLNGPIKLVNKIFKKKANKKTITENADVTIVEENNGLIPEASDNVAKGFGVTGHVVRIAIPWFWPAEIIEVVGHGLIKASYDKEIIDQQYRYGIFAFYFKKLAKFME